MGLELALKSDMIEYTTFSINTDDQIFNIQRQSVQDTIGGLISDELLTAILALTRDQNPTNETYDFWFNYVRPYTVHTVFVALMQTHGFNVTNTGITTFKDGKNTAGAISEKERSQLIRKWKTKQALWHDKMLWEFENMNQVFDGVTYTVNSKKYKVNAKRSMPINIFGGVNKNLRKNRKFRL